MNSIINSLKVLRGLQNDKLFFALTEYFCCEERSRESKFNDLIYEIFSARTESNVSGYVSELVLTDDNAFSKSCANGRNISEYLCNAFADDLDIIKNMLKALRDSEQFDAGEQNNIFIGSTHVVLNRLKSFYASNGYGKFIRNKAFTYENERLFPLCNTTEITLEQLKNYENEKAIVLDNVKDFLKGLPYSHMLLYGDKGTGKSSTIHAIANKCFGEKLRLIEVSKKDIPLIPAIRQKLAYNPLKFILFLDDLSLDERNDDISTLKTVFEGSFSSSFGNVMLVATSNRRHIVKENFSDRQNSVHPSDSMDEQLSLADRFGLTVMFSTTDKQDYLSIIDQLATDANLKTEREKLYLLAERWALLKGGRSPRRAKQFIDYAYACEQSKRPIDF